MNRTIVSDRKGWYVSGQEYLPVGLWKPLSPESRRKCDEQIRRHFAKPVEQRMEEYREALRKGFEMLNQVFTEIQQDRNVKDAQNIADGKR